MPLPGKGLVLRFDGKTWSKVSIPDTPFLAGVWGTAQNDVFAVGVNLAILRFDGKAWAAMKANAPLAPDSVNFLTRVWAAGPNDVYAAGFDGVLLRYDGRAWTPVPLATKELLGVFGVGQRDVFVVAGGGIILHHRLN